MLTQSKQMFAYCKKIYIWNVYSFIQNKKKIMLIQELIDNVYVQSKDVYIENFIKCIKKIFD